MSKVTARSAEELRQGDTIVVLGEEFVLDSVWHVCGRVSVYSNGGRVHHEFAAYNSVWVTEGVEVR
jgi:hypothetical protein